MGIKTIINLRTFHSDADEMTGTGLLDEELSVKTWHIEDEDVIRVLRIIRKKENGPFLIHCQHGADRTGVMSAMYRIVEQGWSKKEAVHENGLMAEHHTLWRSGGPSAEEQQACILTSHLNIGLLISGMLFHQVMLCLKICLRR